MEETMVSSLTYQDDLDEFSGQHGKIELLVSCTELAKVDTFSKTDPMCALFIKRFGQWKEYGRTEAVMDMVNPKFTETFVLDYDSEINQQIMFSIYDVDSRTTDLQKHNLFGSVEMTLEHLVQPGQSINTICRSLRVPGDPQARGLISITAEFIKETRSRLHLHLGASKLDKKGLLATKKTDTYVELSRSINSIDFHPVYRTEVFHKSQDPRWKQFEIPIQKLCNGDPERSIQFSCWHLEGNNQERKLIGQLTTTLRSMINRSSSETSHVVLPLIQPRKAKKKSYKASGQLLFFQCRLDMAYSVLDYVRGGCSMKFMVAIDFTSSNGGQGDPMSLHYITENNDNQYEDAIKTIGSMLSHYDLEQQFPAYGFGAKLKSAGETKWCFPLTGKSSKHCVHGITGLVNAYRRMVPRLTFGGPSRLSPVIRSAIEIVKKGQLSQENQQYHVLLIITDGILNDTDEALQAVLDSSNLPLSIVIVGIGPADFTAMKEFQCTVEATVRNKSMKNSQLVVREHLHFTALRKQKYLTNANASIAKETLAKVSTQMVKYLKQKDLVPNRPKLQKTEPTEGGWISKDVNLNDVTNDSAMYSLSQETQNFTYSRGGRSMTFTNTLHLKGNISTETAAPTCPTCGSTIDLNNENVLSTFL